MEKFAPEEKIERKICNNKRDRKYWKGY